VAQPKKKASQKRQPKLTSKKKLCREWHPTKNGDLEPKDITCGSRRKVWWKCSKIPSHVWPAQILNRIYGSGCPYCSGRLASPENNLAFLQPDIAAQFHPTKNGKKTAYDFTAGSGQTVWWRCSKGHDWPAVICSRTNLKLSSGCPICAGRKPSDGRPRQSITQSKITVTYPKIAKEFHPEKNNDLQPNKISYGSGLRVWWKCAKGHDYEAIVSNRTLLGSNCPYCSNQSSEFEVRILAELKYAFPEAVSGYNVVKRKLDIYLPTINFGVEYDSHYRHVGAEIRDLEKNKLCQSQGISVLRVREKPLQALSKTDVLIANNDLKKSDLNSIYKQLSPFAEGKEKQKITKYLNLDNWANEDLFRTYLSYFPFPFPESSLAATHPKLAKEWDHDTNSPLTPSNFTYGSTQIVGWICPKKHRYRTKIKYRARRDKNKRSACPYCAGKKVSIERSLAELFPTIASEWHPFKNHDRGPRDFTYGSNERVWWQCSKGHEYDLPITSRTHRKRPQGCPYCAGKRISTENSMVKNFPHLKEEWVKEKNDKDVLEVSYGSSYRAWWRCKTCQHEWQAVIQSRTSRGHGCPKCAGKKV
jgi:hypothetical protein